jgi:multidrug efflux system outer membrane protein
MRTTRLLIALLGASVLVGCATVPAVDPQLPARPETFAEDDRHSTLSTPAEAQPSGTWWLAFADPVLDQLVTQAAERNASLQVAAARLAQARALERSADSQRALQVDVGASLTRQVEPAVDESVGTVGRTGALLSYKLDLSGRLSKVAQAAALDTRSQQSLLQSTRLLVQSNVAETYLGLRAFDAEISLVRDTVLAYRETLRLTEQRARAGDAAELDVARVRTEVALTESEALALERRRAEDEHVLAVLVGEAASTFHLAPTKWNAPLPLIPPGVPSTVLARRADVSAAQTTFMAAQARVGAAQAAWFPSLSLTASGGFASANLADLFDWASRAWQASALLALPLFDGGRREAGVQRASADLEAAAAAYRTEVLTAFKDVEDQLSALRILSRQAAVQRRAVESATRATQLSDSRYRNGLVSQLELLDAQRSELSSRRQALHVRSAQYRSTVGLVRALGGGWEQ